MNGNLSERVHMDTTRMPWSASPSGTVWRKRMHLVGRPESGQVTSIVRFDAASSFPAHDHPDGEEIFVLEGVFSDEYGDWPAGTFLLNPEGFRHTPYSAPGCVLFVKLRQFPGLNRRHVVVDSTTLPWEPSEFHGVQRKLLYEQDGFSDVTRLEHWAADTVLEPRIYAGGVEIFVLQGEFEDDEGRYRAGSWLRLPAGDSHSPRALTTCTLYLESGGLVYLDSA